MDLFDHARDRFLENEQPLAARLRPRTLDEFVGQEHILAPGRLLRRAIQADQLSSLIFYGPPGTGKTTLASVIANTTESHFEVLNAVLSGVKDVREVTEQAQRRLGEYGQRTILFVDEVHRWNKSQQDGLLPWVENGTVILIGATTENPYFTVNRALASRSRIFQLKPLATENLREVAARALSDSERGYGKLTVSIEERALDHLLDVANGDARGLLNALELAIETTPPGDDGVVRVDMHVAEESIQRRAVLYDKEGDYHFDTISAFIKSLRGSDPDAAMYWLAKMVYAGEDPRFLFRRMLIFCGEDIGLADPNALVVTQSAAAAFDRVGMPEGRYHLGMAALYLATAPKSNSVFAFFDALAAVENEKDGEVPNHLKDASRDKEGFGHGAGYLYPHAYRDHWVAQQYLPDSLQGKVFYSPGSIGHEKGIALDVQRRREAQLAATVDPDVAGAPPEILTFSPTDRSFDRWLTRTISGIGDRLAELRDVVFDGVSCSRHSRVLALNETGGVLVWEALRRTPEGGVWAVAPDATAAGALREQAEHCPDLCEPHVLTGGILDVSELLGNTDDGDVRFDLVVGRNALGKLAGKKAAFECIANLLADGGELSLVEVIPAETQRLYKLVDLAGLPEAVSEGLVAAEEAIYASPNDPMVNWQAEDLGRLCEDVGLEVCLVSVREMVFQQTVTAPLLARWFSADSGEGERSSYAQRLSATLTPEEVEQVKRLYTTRLSGQTVSWRSSVAVLRARKK